MPMVAAIANGLGNGIPLQHCAPDSSMGSGLAFRWKPVHPLILSPSHQLRKLRPRERQDSLKISQLIGGEVLVS